jgi:hypothetical protein
VARAIRVAEMRDVAIATRQVAFHTIANGSRAAITIAVAALPSRQLRRLTRLDIRLRSLRAAGFRLACVGG